MKNFLLLGLIVVGAIPCNGQAADQNQPILSLDDPIKHSNSDPDENDIDVLNSPIARPYISAGLSLMGAGYARLAYRIEAGIDMESTHAIVRALGAYDDGHQIHDADQPNPHGHDRYLEGAAYFRTRSRWFLGLGWRWNRLYTTNYTKGGSGPEFGGGYDINLRSCRVCSRYFSMRIEADWVIAGTDWRNGSHGINTHLTFPANSEKRHWFWRQSVGAYAFHQTVTEPTNLPLVQFQLSKKGVEADANFAIVYRF